MLRNELSMLRIDHGLSEFRKFGRTMGIFLIILGLILCYISSSYTTPLLTIGSALLLAGVFYPVILKPFYVLWMSFAVSLGYFMTRFILGAIFFLIFSPVGLVFRLIRKDHLDEAIDPDADSYWKKREAIPYEPGMSDKQS